MFRIVNLDSMEKSSAEMYLTRYFQGWAITEGWNPGEHDVQLYFASYPKAFYVLEVLRDTQYEVASIIFAPYDSYTHQASIGIYISEKSTYRGKGYAYQLWQYVLQKLSEEKLDCRKFLYGVPAQVENYKKSGFKSTHNILHYIMKTDQRYGPLRNSVDEATATNYLELLQYVGDNYSEGLARFIKLGIDEKYIQAQIARDAQDPRRPIIGFGMLRPLVDGKSFRYTIMTDMRVDHMSIADDLFRALNQLLKLDQLAVLDVCETHPMVKLYEHYSIPTVAKLQEDSSTQQYGQPWTTEMCIYPAAQNRMLNVAAEPSLETNFLPRFLTDKKISICC